MMNRTVVVLVAAAAWLATMSTAVASASPAPPTTQMIVARYADYHVCNVNGAAGKAQKWWRSYNCLWAPRPDPTRPWALDVNGI